MLHLSYQKYKVIYINFYLTINILYVIAFIIN